MQQAGNISSFKKAFREKLEQVNIDTISPELYCRKYLNHLLSNKMFYLAIYADVLEKLLKHSTKKKEEIILVDFGAGNGLLGIFAKYCGFKKVFINDIDPKFTAAARKLAEALGINPDGYITGDIVDLKSFFTTEVPNAIIGTDVIEHIYNPETFFTTLQQLNPGISSVFTTASNPLNYFKVRSLRKIQVKDELEGGTPADSILFGAEAHDSFLKTREDIIRLNGAGLPDSEIEMLAAATRGLNKQDIIIALNRYREDAEIPQPAEGTNTCNPLTGSWTERILPLEAYVSLYANAGFTCRFYAGFYNDYGGGLRNFVKKLLNAGIVFLGKRISPYIVIVGSGN